MQIGGILSASWLPLLISIFHPSPATRHFLRRESGEGRDSILSCARRVGRRREFERRSPNFSGRKTENGASSEEVSSAAFRLNHRLSRPQRDHNQLQSQADDKGRSDILYDGIVTLLRIT